MSPNEIIALAKQYTRTSGHPAPEVDDDWMVILNEALLYFSDLSLSLYKEGVALSMVGGQSTYVLEDGEGDNILLPVSVRVDGKHLVGGTPGLPGPVTKEVIRTRPASSAAPRMWAHGNEGEITLWPTPEGAENVTVDGYIAHPEVTSDFSPVLFHRKYHRAIAVLTAVLAMSPYANDSVVDKVQRLSTDVAAQLAELMDRASSVRARAHIGSVYVGSLESDSAWL